MNEATAGDLVKFLAANPGPHRVGPSIAQYVASFPTDVWKQIAQDVRDEGER